MHSGRHLRMGRQGGVGEVGPLGSTGVVPGTPALFGGAPGKAAKPLPPAFAALR